MKCYHHPDRDAVATCTECGRGLCKECADVYSKPLCADCAVSYAKRIKENLEKAYLLSAILLLFSAILIFLPVSIHTQKVLLPLSLSRASPMAGTS